MTQVSSAPELIDDDEHISPSMIFKRIYAFFYNKTVGVILILLMAVLAFFGTIIMQMPAGALENPDTKAAWLESVRPKYGGWTPVLDFLGFFRMYSSPIFLITCVLLG
ncbi:MAG: cytochrome c biogenesis protein ResB, partial [Trueperella sp.]|nr:cytochrome c biogenesis protein ResB [Trueperella sp.]